MHPGLLPLRPESAASDSRAVFCMSSQTSDASSITVDSLDDMETTNRTIKNTFAVVFVPT